MIVGRLLERSLRHAIRPFLHLLQCSILHRSIQKHARRYALVNPAFVESSSFTRAIVRLGLEDDLRLLQWSLRRRPDAGAIEPGTGGLRKIRIGFRGQAIGKRGGARIHYLYVAQRDVIYLLSVYRKSEQSTLTAAEKRILRQLVTVLKREPINASR